MRTKTDKPAKSTKTDKPVVKPAKTAPTSTSARPAKSDDVCYFGIQNFPKALRRKARVCAMEQGVSLLAFMTMATEKMIAALND